MRAHCVKQLSSKRFGAAGSRILSTQPISALRHLAFQAGHHHQISTTALSRKPAKGRHFCTLSRAVGGSSSFSSQASSQMEQSDYGAYIDRDLHIKGAAEGPLKGYTVAIKDMYDVAGHRTGFGNPVWLETHGPATATAPAVQRLLDAGAAIRGRTHMDELAYSLNGENAHYGTPQNPAAPGHIPGGSSSGSAVAVAAGHVDIGLGSDTGGSVRIPASYCGVLGFRPSAGRITLEGARPLAPTFDSVGWFTRDAKLLRAVGSVLLEPYKPLVLPSPTNSSSPATAQTTGSTPASPAAAPSSQGPNTAGAAARSSVINNASTSADASHNRSHKGSGVRWLIATDAFDMAEGPTAEALRSMVTHHMAAIIPVLGGAPPVEVQVGRCSESLRASGCEGLRSWLDVFRVCQAWEVWQAHGDWVRSHDPEFGPGIRDRFDMASRITQQEWAVACEQRRVIRDAVLQLLGSDGVLMLPTAPGPAPVLNTPTPQLDVWRQRMISLTSIAGLCGCPQVTLPVAKVDGLPVGLSLLGRPGSDEVLLELAEELMKVMA